VTGKPCRRGERNYLELYGIPPSLSVLRTRFLADAARTCEASVDNARLLAVDGIETFGHSTEKKEANKHRLRGLRLEAARGKAGVATLEELASADPSYAGAVKTHLRVEAERAAFVEVEKRLVCEGLMDPAKHKPGSYDAPMRSAVLDFQQKNGVFAQADLTRTTLEAMGRPLLANDFATLRRVLAERARPRGQLRRGRHRHLPHVARQARQAACDSQLSKRRRNRGACAGSGGASHGSSHGATGPGFAEDALAFFPPPFGERLSLAAGRSALSRSAAILRAQDGPCRRDRPRRYLVRLSL